ncbi:MAG: class I SAM-dependent methyltransferase [Spirochaetes bacterium]|nr:class I SAM-dependent methyltransferase [Spirochaetota bacterium]
MRKYILICIIGLLILLMCLWFIVPQKRNDLFNPRASWTLTNPITYYAPFFGTRNILARMPVRTGMRVLDVGCGPGRFTIPLAKAVGPSGKVVAVDIQKEMVALTARYAAEEGMENVETRVLDVASGDGTLEAQSFDFSLMVTVLGEIPPARRPAALREIHRLLKPGGILSITEIQSDTDYLPVALVRGMAAKEGFRERRCFSNCRSYTLTLIKP